MNNEYGSPKWAQILLWVFILAGCVAPLFAQVTCEPDVLIQTLTLLGETQCPDGLPVGSTCLAFVSSDQQFGYMAVVWNDILIVLVKVSRDGTTEVIYQAVSIVIQHKKKAVWKCEGMCA